MPIVGVRYLLQACALKAALLTVVKSKFPFKLVSYGFCKNL